MESMFAGKISPLPRSRKSPCAWWLIPCLLILLTACGGGSDDDSDNKQPVDTTPPAAVSGFSAVAIDQSVNLSWNNPADSDFAGVIIRRSTSGNPASATDGSAVYNGGGTTTTDAGLSNGTTYYYSIFAYDEVPNYSGAANLDATPVAPTAGDTTPPAAVSNLTATAQDQSINLNWDNPADSDFAGVIIRRSTSGNPTSVTDGIAVYNGASTTTTDSGLTNGTTYFYSIFAYDAVPNYSGVVSANATPADTTPPAVVSNFTATAQDQSINLSWNNPGDSDFAGVIIRRSTSGNPASISDGTEVYNGAGSSITDSGLTNGTTYYYSIFTYDEVPNYSGAVSINARPTSLNVDAGSDQTIVLADAANLNAIATENGQPPQGTVTYSWTQVSGPGIANFTDASAAQTSVSFTEIGSYELGVEATSNSEAATDNLLITVNLKAAGSPGLSMRPANATECIAPPSPPVASSILLENPYPNLPALNTPLAMYMAPGDSSYWYVVQQTGQVIRFANNPAVNSTTTFIDISDRVEYYGEMGLLGMAFHPDYANNGYVYLSYNNTDSGRDSRISRFTRVGDVLDPSSEVIILTLTQPSTNHNGGQIMFGPDGYLYIGLGDGGGSYDTYANGQNTDTLLGALLRIDVGDGSSGSYTIPPDNPFAASGGAPEIFAYGLRNPWRWSFDRQTGDIWAGDVGQGSYEEIDIITKGANYGWPIMEGPNCVTAGCNQTGLTLPVGGYERSLGQSITGGYVYRGSNLGFLYGQYIYGDFSIGRIWALQKTGASQYTSTELLDTSLNIASFAEDHDGELYVINLYGGISKIVADSSSQTGIIPTQLSDWGCFQSTDTTLFSDNVIPYNINALLWSDFANKERFMAIPDGTTINIDGEGRFDLPVGSVVGKHFWLDGQLIETRLLLHHEAPHGWKGYSYEWNDTHTDATLLTTSKDKDFDVNSQTQTWHYPSRAQCDSCHTTIAGFTLGPEIGQLNRSLFYPTTSIEANQLITLEDINVLSRALSDAEKSTTFYAIDDIAYSSERRARSYLHSNCANCHQPGGPGGGNMDLRMATSLANTGICNHAPLSDTLGLSDPMIVAPGDPDNSILVLRMEDLGQNRMPPLATSIVDTQAISVIRDWISNLATCQ
ncbi:MAG: PQQ-dependent sugar dehydrogenase [Thioalkalispiraceae bacterium]|jgi:uncharacterized repeat protein (TIGR03806 family)